MHIYFFRLSFFLSCFSFPRFFDLRNLIRTDLNLFFFLDLLVILPFLFSFPSLLVFVFILVVNLDHGLGLFFIFNLSHRHVLCLFAGLFLKVSFKKRCCN